jgi:hypothetical protein
VTLDIAEGSAFCLLDAAEPEERYARHMSAARPDHGHVFVHGKDVAALTGRDPSGTPLDGFSVPERRTFRLDYRRQKCISASAPQRLVQREDRRGRV